MVEVFNFKDVTFIPNYLGDKKHRRISYPLRVGRFSLIETPETKFFFNLRGEIRFIHGKDSSWPHPNEFLKRSQGNDWIYYSSGEYYGGIFSALGEYYVPCMLYPSNNLWGNVSFLQQIVGEGRRRWRQVMRRLFSLPINSLPPSSFSILKKILKIDEDSLSRRSSHLYKILGCRPSVLPPDTRDVDYECIPLIISEGCLYHCKFCRVKSSKSFQVKSKKEIEKQILLLRDYYKEDLINYNAIYLGDHDGLAAPWDILCFAMEEVYENLLTFSYLQGRYLFLFASVDSFLAARWSLFEYLNSLPDTYVYINIGLESLCDITLSTIGKPITSKQVRDAFWKMQDINRSLLNIEVTGNFLFSLDFPNSHFQLLKELLGDEVKRPFSKGRIYISPMSTTNRGEQLKKFMQLKRISRLPVFLYVIQRF